MLMVRTVGLDTSRTGWLTLVLLVLWVSDAHDVHVVIVMLVL